MTNVKAMHIPNTSILDIMKYIANITIAIKYEIIYGLSIGIFYLWPWQILKVKVKNVYILMKYIIEMMTYRLKITISIILQVMYGLYIDLSTFDLVPFWKSGQRLAHFDNECLENGDRWEKIALPLNSKSCMKLRLTHLHLTLTNSKAQG